MPAQEQTEPVVTIPQEPVVTNYTVETVSTARAARTLNVARNASTYNLLRNSLMSVYDTRDGASTQAEVEQKNAEGLVTSKDVNDDDKDGIYTVTLEAYTTGKVTTSTKTIPVDIVLVLDQSGSMAYNFNGNSTNNNSERRQYAMKQTINNFISSVSKKYSEDADHRISIVTFSSEAETLQGWTYVDEVGKTTLQGKISGLPKRPDGATNISAGMGLAENLMGEGYNYTGTNTQRQKVVVAFTDGVPTTETDFDVGVANGAISFANALKKSGVTIYSVGIFNGAKINELYGASGFDRNSDGSVGSNWSDFSFWMIGDIRNYDIPAGNRFLNYLSSNFADTTEIGLTQYKATILGVGYHGWKITRNFVRTTSNYYLTANDSTSLNQIFQTISQTIQTPSIDLGSKTEVRDVISPYFDLPENVSESGIKLYTAAAKDDGTFEERVPDPSGVAATISSDNKTVSVTGFDFNANFVSENAKEDGTYGKKLIITFDIVPNYDTTLGGSGIASNGDDSGIYNDGTVIEHFYRPTVDVKTAKIIPNVSNQNIYLSDPADLTELLAGTDSRINGSGNAGVDVTYTLYQVGNDGNGTAIATLEIPAGKSAAGYEWTAKSGPNLNPELDSCTEYYIVCEVVATEDGSNSSTGTSDNASVHVYKPEVTFKDSTIYLSQTPVYKDENYLSEVWKDDREEAPDTMGAAPTLVYDYTPVDNSFDSCTDVNVTVKIDEVDVTEHVTFANGESSHAGSVEAKEFTVHVLKPSFTVTCADLWADYDESFTLRGTIVALDGTIDYYISTAIEGWTDAKGHEDVNEDGVSDENKAKIANADVAFTYRVEKATDTDEPKTNYYVTPYEVKTSDEPFNVALNDFTINGVEYGSTYENLAGEVTFKDGKSTVVVHVNKFNLTIKKDWHNVEDCYKQDVIFTITGDYGTGEDQNIQVVIPVGKTSVKVVGLLCGQNYTVKEANTKGKNWAWRFSKPDNQTAECGLHGVTLSDPHRENTYTPPSITFKNDRPNTKWFDAIAVTVKNIFGKGDNQ